MDHRWKAEPINQHLELIDQRNEAFASWQEKKTFLDGAMAMLRDVGCTEREMHEELKEILEEEDRLFMLYVKAFNRCHYDPKFVSILANKRKS